ncbi:hypothetical protein LOK46_10625 [Methylobacterium sp. NMS14P]|uniref:hypothetical protein n=1 Tax=Methylobacterium sp. NMS14P TaxID=2894310 RepID=UPI0023589C70|nr:hypothetical protein [Methylobacterium sp. NMS14P]WCS27244.1 hypothetical protein LOK46_10625 [Methylobacterium sp. NMS14P]
MNARTDFARLEREWGIIPLGQDWMPEEFRRDFHLAMDAQPVLVTTPSAGIPAYLTTYTDPEVVRILQTPNKGAELLGEKKVGDWTTQTAMFPVIENTGEVSSYGDFNENGKSDANFMFPQRQSYKFQTIIEYGDLAAEVAGLAKLNWVGEQQQSGAMTLEKFRDYSYHFGIANLQNYGTLNDPALSAAITPSAKAAGGNKWVNNGVVVATPNEVNLDLQSLMSTLIAQTGDRVSVDDELVLVVSPGSNLALTAVNNFGVSANDLLKKTFPRLTVVTDARYATASGNVAQLWAKRFDGNDVGYCAFGEKMRDFPLVRELSAAKQKKAGTTWGAIIKYPLACAQMLGI